MKKTVPDAVLIFILPNSMEGLYSRLNGRQTDSPDVIKLRMRNAEGEIKKALEYDYAVVNDDLEQCRGEVLEIIKALGSDDANERVKAEKYCVKNNIEYIKNLIGRGN